MKNKKGKFDEFHYHEILDRAHLLGLFLDVAFMAHPVIKEHKDMKKKVRKAQKALAELYQMVGGTSYQKFHLDE